MVDGLSSPDSAALPDCRERHRRRAAHPGGLHWRMRVGKPGDQKKLENSALRSAIRERHGVSGDVITGICDRCRFGGERRDLKPGNGAPAKPSPRNLSDLAQSLSGFLNLRPKLAEARTSLARIAKFIVPGG